MLRRKKDPLARWKDRGVMALLWGIVVLSFVLALGQNTPVFPFLFKHVPTFDMFQAPARYLIWATFGLAVLGGLGADRWRCPEKRGLYWLRLGTAGMFAVTLGAGIAWQTMGDVRLTFIRATALAGGWALGTGLFTLLIPLVRKTRQEATVEHWRDLMAVRGFAGGGVDAQSNDQPRPLRRIDGTGAADERGFG